jgi:hypothetical protein
VQRGEKEKENRMKKNEKLAQLLERQRLLFLRMFVYEWSAHEQTTIHVLDSLMQELQHSFHF